MRNFMLKQQLAWLIKQAEAGKDPDLYAELLLDQVGETVVLEFIEKPDALDQLAALNPGVVGQRIWFERLRDAILDLTAPDPAGEGGLEGELIPAEPIDHAIPDAANAGDVTGTPDGSGGDTPNP